MSLSPVCLAVGHAQVYGASPAGADARAELEAARTILARGDPQAFADERPEDTATNDRIGRTTNSTLSFYKNRQCASKDIYGR